MMTDNDVMETAVGETAERGPATEENEMLCDRRGYDHRPAGWNSDPPFAPVVMLHHLPIYIMINNV